MWIAEIYYYRLDSYFTIQCDNLTALTKLINELRGCEVIEIRKRKEIKEN